MAQPMHLPDELVQRLRMGEVVIFLGAGASFGARDDSGKIMPQVQQLSDYLADKFLTENYRGRSLSHVGQTALGYVGVEEVQKAVAELIRPMNPLPFHLLLPRFRWRMIATTNYDLIVEKSYEIEKQHRLQQVVPWVRNLEKIDNVLRDYSKTLYLKLHGCVNFIENTDVQLILSPEQFNEFRTSRSNLFDYFRQVAQENPVVWIGFGMMDQDILSIIQDIEKDLGKLQTMHYIVDPGIDEIRAEIFRRRNIHHLAGNYEDFLIACDTAIPENVRTASGLVNNSEYPIAVRLNKSTNQLSQLPTLLEADFEHIRVDMGIVGEDPQLFYQGLCRNFTPIQMDWDVKRSFNNKILKYLSDQQPRVESQVLIGAAGMGKSISLRRLAWSLAERGDLVLYMREQGQINLTAISELLEAIDERLYLLIDNATRYRYDIENLIRMCRASKSSVTIILAARQNEWNLSCENLDSLIPREKFYELHHLSEREVDDLLYKLEKNRALGDLATLPHEKRKDVFMRYAQRQILVALFEATHSENLEQIILNEYRNIDSVEAKNLYRGVALLHRLGIKVRAMLINKIYHIPFEQFETRFYKPLEKVIFADKDPEGFKYRTRHPEIAQILFNQVYLDPEERLSEVIRTLEALNVSLESDLQAFRELINNRKAAEYFKADPEAARRLYESALKVGESREVLRQWGLFELRRGKMDSAWDILEKAFNEDPYDAYTLHAMAEFKYKQAEDSLSDDEFNLRKEEAGQYLEPLLRTPRHSAVATHTLAKLDLAWLRRVRSKGNHDKTVEAFTMLERRLHRAQGRFPGDEKFLQIEAQANQILKRDTTAIQKMEIAHRKNPDQAHIIRQLYQLYKSNQEFDKAARVLEDGLSRLPDNRDLNFLQFERVRETADPYTLISLLNKSVTEGDGNRDRLFWQARYHHQYGKPADRNAALRKFERIREQVGAVGSAGKIKDRASENGKFIYYTGEVSGKHGAVLWIKRDIDGEMIFCHKSKVSDETWDDLTVHDRVRFNIGYRLAGPVALDVEVQ